MTKRSTLIRAALSCAAAPVVLLLLNWAIPTVYYSPRIDARVVGRDGAPLANALVVANWNIVGPWNGASLGQLALAEVRTGPDGSFSIPAWGPRMTLHGAVEERDPTLRIIKQGFQPRVIQNNEAGHYGAAATVIRFRLQGQDIVLTPLGGAGDAAALAALYESAFVLCGFSPPPCLWTQMLMNRARLPDRISEPDRPAGRCGPCPK